MASGALGEWGERLEARVGEFSASIHFLTRLPLPRHEGAAGANLAQAAWAFPLAGFVVGLIGAIAYALAHKLVVFAWPAAALTVAATLLVTGALHEDGLADTADGFGGGDTREKKLAIMRDSRIGTYALCALAMSLLIRISALASLADPAPVAAALIAAHAGARATMPLLMFFVPPARKDGLSFDAGRPASERVAVAAILGVLFLAGSLGLRRAIEAVILLTIVIVLMARLSLKQIGGQTGDVAGALEQISEMVILLVALR
jgi:adenosylcobinamide-GDP ribazoletransferase